MPCYFRILKDVFDEAGIDLEAVDKKRLDLAIHQIMGVEYKDCPATGRAVKARVLGDEGKRAEFVKWLRDAVL